MPRFATILLALPALLTAPLALHAADEDGNFAVRGLGTEACSAYVESAEAADGTLQEYLSWLQGYVTAVNRFKDDTFDAVPVLEITFLGGMLYNICADNPESNLEAASYALADFMHEARVRESSGISRVTVEDDETLIRAETLQSVIARLAEDGYIADAEAEITGVALRDALRSFQQENDLEQSGLPDSETVIQLLLR